MLCEGGFYLYHQFWKRATSEQRTLRLRRIGPRKTERLYCEEQSRSLPTAAANNLAEDRQSDLFAMAKTRRAI